MAREATAPLVSVCIPSFDYAPFLPTAVESVLAQTYPHLELLICDDGSTDGSLEIARRYEAADPRVRVLTHPDGENRGVSPTLNLGYASARGDYVANVAADDALAPTSIERRVAPLLARPEARFSYCRYEWVAADGASLGMVRGESLAALAGRSTAPGLLEAIVIGEAPPGGTYLVERELFLELGGYDDRLLFSDWELLARLLAHADGVFVDDGPLLAVRHHPDSRSMANPYPHTCAVFRTLDEKGASIGGRFAETALRALVRLQHGFWAAQIGELEESRAALQGAFELDPTLADRAEYLLWWAGTTQIRPVPCPRAGRLEGWLTSLRRAPARPELAVARGALSGHFGCRLVEATQGILAPRTHERLSWGVIAAELDTWAAGDPALFLSVLLRALRRPSLLRERWFVKALLCAAGVWNRLPPVRHRRTSLATA